MLGRQRSHRANISFEGQTRNCLQPRNMDCHSEEEQDRTLEEALSAGDWVQGKPSNDDDMSSGAEGRVTENMSGPMCY